MNFVGKDFENKWQSFLKIFWTVSFFNLFNLQVYCKNYDLKNLKTVNMSICGNPALKIF